MTGRTASAGRPRIRPVGPADVVEVVSMVHELAAYERAPDSCLLTEGQLREALFGPTPALFGHVVESPVVDSTVVDGHVAGRRLDGFALWFLNFSTWQGVHGMYLEDLYVRPHARATGCGRALLAELARVCVDRGYVRLEWWVLNWNEPALQFYRRAGARPMDEWTVWRLTGDALSGLAAGQAAPAPPGK